ncbi:MAG: hypothetical protein Q9182_003579 [Xanthomendoza sp. 2 TL-2023]
MSAAIDAPDAAASVLPGSFSIVPGDVDLNGELTTYAHAENIVVAGAAAPNAYDEASGTSYTAPQIAGLAAYLLGLAKLDDPASYGTIPMAVKNYIVATGRDEREDGVSTAYNGVRELICDAALPKTLNKKLHRAAKDTMALDIDVLDP